MYSYEKRLDSFREWPFTERCLSTPENMAKAGFIHFPGPNNPDVVICFFCLKELDNWEPEDDPWKEHQSHSPNCGFLALKSDVDDITVEEFLKLEMERLKIYMRKVASDRMSRFKIEIERARKRIVEDLSSSHV
ncbi:baculoviral IAP repeat-containing protein 5.1-B-like [Callorhinchus milii]|nr:baculoviral IAP repeat-containing protein 5.1-B-like [Callorhinchus milii]